MSNEVLYGFTSLADVFGQRVTTLDIRVINTAIQASIDEHNRQLDAMMSLFVQQTSDHQLRYMSVTNARLQPLDEFGRPQPIKAAGYYDIAFPLVGGTIAWGATRVARAKMTVGEVNRLTAQMILADTRWMRDHLLGALFAAASYSYVDPQWGTLTVMPLASGDSQTYTIQTGADAVATDTHLLAQAAAISDAANPFPAIYTELIEHSENSGDVVALVASNLIADIEALTTFHLPLDPNLRSADTTTVLTGTLGVRTPGVLRGYADRVWIVEWPSLPSGYMIAVTTNGDPPIGMRQHPEAELQGFNNVAQRDDYPYYETDFERYCGFGAWNRVGAVIYRVGNASYAVPTSYNVPMP